MRCSEKQWYFTRAAAKRAARAVKGAGKGHLRSCARRLRPYQCDVCGMWHLTSKARRVVA